jgi:hypothetical protein
MRTRLAVAVVLGLALLGVLLMGAASPARAANDANAKLCQHGGWQAWVRADYTPFLDQGECVSYAAHGGTLTAPASAAQTVCESYGGTFGNTNSTMGSWPTILWTCNYLPYVSEDDQQAKFIALADACLAGGGTGWASSGGEYSGRAYFTCGHS